MFRELRRKRQELPREECLEILCRGSDGVLAVLGEGGYPYAVPLNYVYSGGKIFFHSASQGHKLDALRLCDKVSFCVVGQDRVVSEQYTTYFKSVIAFGRARVLTDAEETRRAIEALALKYVPEDSEERRAAAIANDWDALCMIELRIEHLSGKECIELTKQREK